MHSTKFQDFAEKICLSAGYKEPLFVGKGAFKETFSVVDKQNVKFALKIFDPSKYNADRTLREINAMQNSNHKRVARLYTFSSVMIENQKVNYTIEEFYHGGSLEDRKNSLTDNDIKSIAVDMLDAITYLKEHNIVHRDIKPENIMFKDSNCRAILVDFGLVRNIGEQSLTNSWIPTGPGTPFYSSPEQLNNEKHMIDWRSDQFSLGIMIAHLVLKKHPFQKHENDIGEAITRVGNKEVMPESSKMLLKSKNFEFVIKMLEPWPIKRFNCPIKLSNQIMGEWK